MCNFFGSLEVVAKHGFFKVGLADVTTRVHVDHGEGLSVFDHQRATRRQPHLAIERLAQLFDHPMLLEEWQAFFVGIPELDAVNEVGVEGSDIVVHFVIERAVVNHDAAIVAAEFFANNPHCKRRFAIQQGRATGLRRRLFDLFPPFEQLLHVGGQFVFGGVLCRGTHDQAVLFRLHSVEHIA